MSPTQRLHVACLASFILASLPTLDVQAAPAGQDEAPKKKPAATATTTPPPTPKPKPRTDRTVMRSGKGGKGGRALAGEHHAAPHVPAVAHPIVPEAPTVVPEAPKEPERVAEPAEPREEAAAEAPSKDEEAAKEDEEEEEEADLLMFAGELRLVSAYAWRGYVLSQDKPSIQPWLSLELGQGPLAGLGVAAWSSTSLWGGEPLDEWNLFISYHREVAEKVELMLGGNLYVEECTAVQPCTDDPQPANNVSGELFAGLALDLDPLFLQLTYSRGFGVAEGNSVSFFSQYVFPTAAKWLNFEAYLQADYLDEFLDAEALAAPIINRFPLVELGLVTHLKFDHIGVLFVVSNVFVPSPYVQASNAESGGPSGFYYPLFGAALAWEAE